LWAGQTTIDAFLNAAMLLEHGSSRRDPVDGRQTLRVVFSLAGLIFITVAVILAGRSCRLLPFSLE
jgi:hypothetical protein